MKIPATIKGCGLTSFEGHLIGDSPKLFQVGVFRFELVEDRHVRVGIFPKSEEIFIDRG